MLTSLLPGTWARSTVPSSWSRVARVEGPHRKRHRGSVSSPSSPLRMPQSQRSLVSLCGSLVAQPMQGGVCHGCFSSSVSALLQLLERACAPHWFPHLKHSGPLLLRELRVVSSVLAIIAKKLLALKIALEASPHSCLTPHQRSRLLGYQFSDPIQKSPEAAENSLAACDLQPMSKDCLALKLSV